MIDWRVSARSALHAGIHVAGELGLKPQTGELEDAFRGVLLLQSRVMDLHKLIFGYDVKLGSEILKVFGERIVARLKLEGEI